MCFAFSDRLEEQILLIAAGDYGCVPELAQSTQIERRDVPPSLIPRKRIAPDSLEKEASKIPKVSGNSDATSEVAVSVVSAQTVFSDEDTIGLTKDLAVAKLRNKRLNKELAELKEKHDEWRDRTFELEAEQEQSKDRAQAEKADFKATQKRVNKKLEESIKAECDKKLAAQKEKHDEQTEDLRGNFKAAFGKKHEAHQKKIDELKANAQRQNQDARDAKDRHIQAEKDLKTEFKEHKKQLKAEQQDEINKFKPEHSQAIKEKNKALKGKQEEVNEFRVRNKQLIVREKELEQGMRGLIDESTEMKSTMRANGREIENLKIEIQARRANIEKLIQEKYDMEKSYMEKLKFEGERWQVQFNKAEKLSIDVVHQQRTTFVLRNSNDRNTKRIEELEVELQTTKEKLDSLRLALAASSEDMVDPEERKTLIKNDEAGESTEHKAAASLAAMRKDGSYQET